MVAENRQHKPVTEMTADELREYADYLDDLNEEQEDRKAEERELQAARERVHKAEAALSTDAAVLAEATLVTANANRTNLAVFQSALDKAEDPAKRAELESLINNLKERMALEEEDVEKAEELYTPLIEELRDARAALNEIQEERLNKMREQGQKTEDNDGPNFWQRYMPGILGGWSSEEVEAWDKAHPAKDEGPNFWQRYMPGILGGWSSEEVEAWDKAHPAKDEGPNFWQRYMPGILGGWSSEEVEEWDKAHPKPQQQSRTENNGPQSPTMWERMTNSSYENARADISVSDAKEVVKGVTVAELRDQGWSEEKIYQLREAVVHAHNRSARGDLRSTLGNAARRNISMTLEDYYQAGLTKEDAAVVYQLSQRNDNDR